MSQADETIDSRPVGPDKHVVAFLDIGTNSVRMLLARIDPNHSFSVISQQKEVVRLGEGEFRDRQLQPAAIRRAVLVCSQFVQMAKAHEATEIIAVATSASREATNQGVFLRRLNREAQLDCRIISGKEEARLIYLGVVSGLNLGEKRALFIDIGGGSTEVIVGTQSQHDFLDSLKLGAIRLTSRFFQPGDVGEVSPRLYQQIKQYVRTTAVRTLQQLKQWRTDIAVGSSGSICNLAEITIRLIYKRPWKKDDSIMLADLKEVAVKLCECTLEERAKLPGINPERADIIVAGAAILETILEDLGVNELRVSERGLREGLPIDYMSRMEHLPPLELRSFRERSVFQLGRSCNFDETHAKNVVRLSHQLFDSAFQLGLHKLGEWERELLEYASLLHDIGSFLSYNNHREHSYYFIRNADLLGFDNTELAIVATTALFHGKALPQLKHPEFAELDKRSRKIVRTLCVFLRMAEALDRSHVGAVSQVRLYRSAIDTICLEMTSANECQLELWGVKRYEFAFEQVFQQKLIVESKVVSLV
ncbi:MAG: Ppx/GppA phosphatase [Planctomycetaceae bacterium]|nr:Ppx/GppA phosphatase [Planctomycetaceae bacterium]